MVKSCRLRWLSGGGIGIEGSIQSRNFYWVDDNPDGASVAALVEIGLLECLAMASTDKRPDDLTRVTELLILDTFN